MEYQPRYTQPFTLTEAIGLDVSVITDEIARLHNSLKHLRETQDMLREYQLTEEPDPEIRKALEENEVVIGSQTERISILKMALKEKGVLDNRHYEVPDTPITASTEPSIEREGTRTHNTTNLMDGYDGMGGDEDGGIHL
ncbi:hypothetical protein P691DRAFT_803248 [Macrolepiota fuliginosa MF-IS2]|uniref:Uncharacterized protein n=1 Tax=Macrolepiota fuliginosa MF-IS2 TaxID=1400762 RepID=A0A9P6C2Y6_9AGAR|nr:hypothetical protein P691DRAFT_803248 [Macrolepiota fuliginosa MF-IS2]